MGSISTSCASLTGGRPLSLKRWTLDWNVRVWTQIILNLRWIYGPGQGLNVSRARAIVAQMVCLR